MVSQRSDKLKELKTTVVDYQSYTDIDFVPPASFFVMAFDQNGNQAYYFIHTSSRAIAQQWCDESFGKGRYLVKASKITKTKSKLESGGLSCHGVSTRRGQKR